MECQGARAMKIVLIMMRIANVVSKKGPGKDPLTHRGKQSRPIITTVGKYGWTMMNKRIPGMFILNTVLKPLNKIYYKKIGQWWGYLYQMENHQGQWRFSALFLVTVIEDHHPRKHWPSGWNHKPVLARKQKLRWAHVTLKWLGQV